MKTNQIIAIAVVILVVASAGVLFTINKNNNSHEYQDKVIPDSDYYPVSITTTSSTTGDHKQTFYEAPKRIVVIFPTNVELLCYFGLEDSIVGAFSSATATMLFAEHQEKYDAIEKISAGASIERMRSLEPDLIIAWTSTFTESRQGTVDMWNGYGINCMITNRPAVTVDDYLKVLRDIGTIFNMNGTAAKKIADFTSAYDDIKKRTANLTNDQKVKALVLEPGYDTGCYAYGASFLTGDLVTRAGGINLFPGSMEMVTFEQVVKYDPDVVIIVPDYSGPLQTAAYSVAEFRAIPGFASMRAVVEDRVIGFEFYEIYMGGFFPDDVLDRIFKALYPD